MFNCLLRKILICHKYIHYKLYFFVLFTNIAIKNTILFKKLLDKNYFNLIQKTQSECFSLSKKENHFFIPNSFFVYIIADVPSVFHWSPYYCSFPCTAFTEPKKRLGQATKKQWKYLFTNAYIKSVSRVNWSKNQVDRYKVSF